MTDKRLQGMDVRYDGRTLRLRAVMAAASPPDKTKLTPFVEEIRKAVAGPDLRMTMVGLSVQPNAVAAEIFVNTDEDPGPVVGRLRDALQALPLATAPWVARGKGANTILAAEELEAEDARGFWERTFDLVRDDLRRRS